MSNIIAKLFEIQEEMLTIEKNGKKIPLKVEFYCCTCLPKMEEIQKIEDAIQKHDTLFEAMRVLIGTDDFNILARKIRKIYPNSWRNLLRLGDLQPKQGIYPGRYSSGVEVHENTYREFLSNRAEEMSWRGMPSMVFHQEYEMNPHPDPHHMLVGPAGTVMWVRATEEIPIGSLITEPDRNGNVHLCNVEKSKCHDKSNYGTD